MHIKGRNTTGIVTGQPSLTSKSLIITGWPESRDELLVDLRPYWSYRDELAVIDGIILKARDIIMPY